MMTLTWQLKAFPTAGSALPILSSISAIKFITSARHILDTGLCKVKIARFRVYCVLTVCFQWPGGVFKVPTPIGWWVVVTDSISIEDLRVAPEHVVLAKGPNEDVSSFNPALLESTS